MISFMPTSITSRGVMISNFFFDAFSNSSNSDALVPMSKLFVKLISCSFDESVMTDP